MVDVSFIYQLSISHSWALWEHAELTQTMWGTDLHSVLFESWLGASGNWKESKIYLSVTQTKSQKRLGKRKWFTKAELEKKFGEEVAGILVTRKKDPEAKVKEWREHPDVPDVEAGMITFYQLCFFNAWSGLKHTKSPYV